MKIIINLSEKDQSFPKAFAALHGKPLIYWNLKGLNIEGDYIFVIDQGMKDYFQAADIITQVVAELDHVKSLEFFIRQQAGTEKENLVAAVNEVFRFQPDEPIIISKYDQMLQWDAEEFINFVQSDVEDEICARLLVFKSEDPHFSFVGVDDRFETVQEVFPAGFPGQWAYGGVCAWSRLSSFKDFAQKCEGDRLIDAFSPAAKKGEQIEIYSLLPEEGERVYMLEFPEDHNLFQQKFQPED